MPLDATPARPVEVWGGVEASIVRIGERWRDQAVETGHRARPEDLERIAALGIGTLRYPVLWESVAPRHPGERDWSWHDERLGRLRRLGISVIAGLLHHGSGPRYTSLLDPLFPEKLAAHAEAVALRYPWVRHFTPVNEPLTTARFSGLYGHWYPHRSDAPAFLRALVNQCRGVVLAMQAIRRVTPEASLVQTEDLGRTFATPLLQYQAAFENERRWLSFDLLCGRVGPLHRLYAFMRANGIAAAELDWLRANARPPDILGMNHYLTSDRYLDERPEAYPASAQGGNGRHRYADVEAVRVDLPASALEPAARLRELWDRYRRPVALTEVHHGCTREEQLRWLAEGWDAAVALKRQGADVRALTVWALLGVRDWNSLLLRQDGFYEPGAFDIRSTPPRPTALAAATAALASGRRFHHPVLDTPGWWRRPGRHYVTPAGGVPDTLRAAPPVLITGGAGRMARVLARHCAMRGLPAVALPRAALDITDPAAVEAALARHRPWAVINAAGHGPEARAARPGEAMGAGVVAAACAASRLPFLLISAAQVFGGSGPRAFTEEDTPLPCCRFGHDKAAAEALVLAAHPTALVIRAGRLVEIGAAGGAPDTPAAAVSHMPDLAQAMLDLLVDGESGIWHLTHPSPEPCAEPGPAPPEGGTVCLASCRGHLMPPLGAALREALWPAARPPVGAGEVFLNGSSA
ncbi:sugar nucleotide-binding protein [Teichococcus aestuarii]|uniref:dTDP-4-dehydrorhamnose reductase n=1 Tax=Teichococcus aestuarii TaxID=568898 RepID=A0A2U1V0T9_9PROT|nr:sugar nucleotide-binding protein [Pseudoroseomonas aestuarii]PWC27520.1 dTDP-4-dehydrorhamnose reductase [Pseudoroseomonas aestuarii]